MIDPDKLVELWDTACGQWRAAFHETPTQVLQSFIELVREAEVQTNWRSVMQELLDHEGTEGFSAGLRERAEALIQEVEVTSNYSDVCEFNRKFGLMIHNRPTHLTTRKLNERIEFMREELQEFEDAANGLNGFINDQSLVQDMVEMADALVDLVYVAMGTAVMMGLPWQQLWDDVHRANMSKVLGPTKRNHRVDLMKPEGWVEPKTLEILTQAGYAGDNIEERKDDPLP